MSLAIHPLDSAKLRDLAEALFDIDAGRCCIDRKSLLSRVRELMLCMRDDCSTRGAGSLLDRILGMTDHRLGAEAIADAVAVEIVAHRARPTLVWSRP